MGGPSESGYTQVYSFDSGTWSEYGNRLSLGTPGDRLGFSVSLSGDESSAVYRLAVGAPGMSQNGEGSGLASVYEYDAQGWTQAGDDLVGQNWGDNLGYAVSLTPDGSGLIVGVP